MANRKDFEKVIDSIHKKWSNPTARNPTFGNLLKSIKLINVRGINTTVEFGWPLTVIGGTNGSGKTTLLQVASAAYARAGSEANRYFKLGDWIRAALPGESPAVVDPASVRFSFWDDTPTLDIPYLPATTRWRYPRRRNPTRNVQFIGISEFAPRIESRGRVHAYRSSLVVKSTKAVDPELVKSLTMILGHPYSGAAVKIVGTQKGKWEDNLPQITRGQFTYGEPHMGAGEQKVFRLVQQLEQIPTKSLVLLEEPETTLHPDAQRGLAWYLMSLALRKGHQIIVATHSPQMFEVMPESGRVLLVRTAAGLEPIHGAPSLVAARELSGSVRTNRDLVLVEDVVAQRFLDEVIRRHDRHLHNQCTIVPVGSKDDVRRMTEAFRKETCRAVGVRDGDTGPNVKNGLLSLPGDAPPEKVLLSDSNISAANGAISGLEDAFEIAKSRTVGVEDSKRAKELIRVLADEVGIALEFLTDRLTSTWLQKHAAEASKLVAEIKDALDAIKPGLADLGQASAKPAPVLGESPLGSSSTAKPSPASTAK